MIILRHQIDYNNCNINTDCKNVKVDFKYIGKINFIKT